MAILAGEQLEGVSGGVGGIREASGSVTKCCSNDRWLGMVAPRFLNAFLNVFEEFLLALIDTAVRACKFYQNFEH